MFKTKNEAITDEQIKIYLITAMKNIPIPSDNDIPSETKLQIIEYAKISADPYKTKDNMRDVIAQIKADIALDTFSPESIAWKIILLIISSLIKGEIEYILMSSLMALSKGGAGSKKFMDNKTTTFRKFWSFEITLREGIEQESQNEIFQFMEYKISKGHLDIELFLDNASKLLELSENVAVTPLLEQISLGKMTTIHAVGLALTQFADFPWCPVSRRMTILKNEIIKFKNITSILDGDRYAGLKFAGVGRLIPNLAYLSIQLLIKAGGLNSYENYRGVGSSTNKSGVNNKYFDQLIKDYVESSSKLDMTELMEENKKYSNFLGKLGMEDSIRKLLDGGGDEDDDVNDEGKKDDWKIFDSPGDSKDDDKVIA